MLHAQVRVNADPWDRRGYSGAVYLQMRTCWNVSVLVLIPTQNFTDRLQHPIIALRKIVDSIVFC